MIKATALHDLQDTNSPPPAPPLQILQMCFTTPHSKQFSGDDLVSVPPSDSLGMLGASTGSSSLGTTSEYDQVRNALRYGDETSDLGVSTIPLAVIRLAFLDSDVVGS